MTKHVNINGTIETLRNNTLLTSEMCDSIKCIPSCCLQAEFILKKVYDFTEERCFQFLRHLSGIDFGKLESGKYDNRFLRRCGLIVHKITSTK